MIVKVVCATGDLSTTEKELTSPVLRRTGPILSGVTIDDTAGNSFPVSGFPLRVHLRAGIQAREGIHENQPRGFV